MRVQTTNVSEGQHITLTGRSVESHVALVEHVTIDHAARDDAFQRGVRDAQLSAVRCDCWRCKPSG